VLDAFKNHITQMERCFDLREVHISWKKTLINMLQYHLCSMFARVFFGLIRVSVSLKCLSICVM
jgi:hypothetical protein